MRVVDDEGAHTLCWYLLIISICFGTTTAHPDGLRQSQNRNAKQVIDNEKQCLTSIDCSMNGECSSQDPNVAGRCQCFPGWTGCRCEEMNLLPARDDGGLQLPNKTSTWGGSVVQSRNNGMYHMFASEMVLGCGLGYWTTNSQVIRAESTRLEGPYVKKEVILETFAHEPNVIEAPTGELVMFVTALANVTPHDCRHEAGTLRGKNRSRVYERNPQRRDTYMLWAHRPEGPWSEPVMVLNCTEWNADAWKADGLVYCDSNLNGIILSNSSFLGLWRRCETSNLLTIPHTLFASDWRDPSTYQPNIDPLFVLGGSGAEDPSNIWTTNTSDMGLAYHVLFHDEQATRCMKGQCSGNGRHAFSLDGKAWRYASSDAYTRHIKLHNGTSMDVDTRARPHVIMGDKINELVALTTGVQPQQDSGYVYTVVQSLDLADSYGLKKEFFGNESVLSV